DLQKVYHNKLTPLLSALELESINELRGKILSKPFDAADPDWKAFLDYKLQLALKYKLVKPLSTQTVPDPTVILIPPAQAPAPTPAPTPAPAPTVIGTVGELQDLVKTAQVQPVLQDFSQAEYDKLKKAVNHHD